MSEEYELERNMGQSTVSEELGTLRNDLNQIRGDLNDLLETFKREKVRPMREAVKEGAQERIRRMQDTIADLKLRGRKAVDTARQKVEERPLASTLAAFGIGILVGKLILRKWR